LIAPAVDAEGFLMIGTTLGNYRILEKIGEGGMGEVFLAEDSSLHRKVALKFLPPAMQQDAMAHKRFLREARSAAALDHPYICHINEVAKSDGRDFIVMEYVDGQPLKKRLMNGPLPLEELLQISIEVVEALEAAHGKGIIHRDIKPANIMLTQTGHAKVTDFGLAKQLSSSAMESMEATATDLTSIGSLVGTPAYMSPEQLLGRAADARSDIWSFGVTLYEMASGAPPFHGLGMFELTSAIMNQPTPPLPSQVPTKLRVVVGRCLEKEPLKRYQQVSEVRGALEAVRAGTAASPQEASRFRLTSHRWLVLTAALGVMAVALVGFNLSSLRERWKSGDAEARQASVMGREPISGITTPQPQRPSTVTAPAGLAPNPAPVLLPASALPAIAVLNFANLQNNPQFESFQTGIAEALTSSFVNSRRFRIVERNQLDKVMKELALNRTPSIDPSTAQKLGRLIGAQYLVLGSFQVFEGEILINARLLRVETGEILQTDKITGQTSKALSLPSSLADKFLAGMQ
jgi:eukaryotic-like serine/threonine-protein kinase